MKIYQHKDFEIWYVSTINYKEIYWAEIGEGIGFSFLKEDGSLVKASDLLFEVVEYKTIEELEDALSLYYKSSITIPILRTKKEVL